MASFGLRPGNLVIVDVDVTRRNMSPLIVYDGPIESETWLNEADFPGKTRLYGRIWTGGPRVTIRYYSARLPDGRVIPFCAMAGEHEGPGLPKSPGRPGSAALNRPDAAVYVVRRFR